MQSMTHRLGDVACWTMNEFHCSFPSVILTDEESESSSTGPVHLFLLKLHCLLHISASCSFWPSASRLFRPAGNGLISSLSKPSTRMPLALLNWSFGTNASIWSSSNAKNAFHSSSLISVREWPSFDLVERWYSQLNFFVGFFWYVLKNKKTINYFLL